MELSYTREIYHSHKLFLVSMDLLEMFKKIKTFSDLFISLHLTDFQNRSEQIREQEE